MKAALIVSNADWRREKSHNGPHRAVKTGLERLGHDVRVETPMNGPNVVDEVDIGFIWNGCHGFRGETVRAFRNAGKPCHILERGFFDRMKHTQIDRLGFNHTASWSGCLSEPAPPKGAGRFRAVWPAEPRTPMSRRDGYALVLLQVAGDSQLRASELRHPGPLVRAVEDALPECIPIRVRAHPMSDWSCGAWGRARMLAGTLEDAVADARFCVTVNSNAGNEALAWGCPVLALGPSLYGTAGVAKEAKLADLQRDLQAMIDGWRPGRTRVTNYLYWLASRQWSVDEIAAGDCLRKVLDAPPA